jgi:hypothetical protein
MKETNPKRNKRKFKQTKQLMRLAINNGWSQVRIAEECRTQQSVVSAWYSRNITCDTGYGGQKSQPSLLWPLAFCLPLNQKLVRINS